MDEIFDAYNIALNRVQKDKLRRFFLFLKEENAKYNLTALTEERVFIVNISPTVY